MPVNVILTIVVVLGVLLVVLRYLPRLQLQKLLIALLLVGVAYFLIITVAEMPPFGDPGNPTMNEVPRRYLERGVEETGAINIISSIIIDYRAYDTLGEATVLFAAIASVIATLASGKKEKGKEKTGAEKTGKT